MKKLGFFGIGILVIVAIPGAFAEPDSISGSSHGYDISLQFFDGRVSGSITSENVNISISDVKVIDRHGKLLVFDKANNLKLFAKSLNSENYLVIAKIDSDVLSTNLRFITSSDNIIKNITQRNFAEEMQSKSEDNKDLESQIMNHTENVINDLIDTLPDDYLGTQNLQNTTRPVFDVVSNITSNNQINHFNKTFDKLNCQVPSDDPLVIKKCHEEKIISKNLNCQGLNYHNPGCDPPKTVYREAPRFYKLSYADVIPQDITFDYLLKMPPDDRDAFAQKMMTFLDDELREEVHDTGNGGKRYETIKGSINISSYMTDSYSFTYNIFGVGRIEPNDGKQFTSDLLNELGIILDGTEFYREGVQGFSNFSYQYYQTKDGMIVRSNWIATTFEEGYTKIYINNWNDNLSEMNLYDIEESIKNGREYAFNNEVLTGIDCQLSLFDRDDLNKVELVILEGRPIYEMYAGSCQVSYMDNHHGWYSVYVDALTGTPLYIQSRFTF